MDFNENKPPEDYLQLIKDADWEHVGTRSGWHSWRNEIQDGEILELFTDPESKIQKYWWLLASYVISNPVVSVLNIISALKQKKTI